MSFVRPELRAACRRWREALAGLAPAGAAGSTGLVHRLAACWRGSAWRWRWAGWRWRWRAGSADASGRGRRAGRGAAGRGAARLFRPADRRRCGGARHPGRVSLDGDGAAAALGHRHGRRRRSVSRCNAEGPRRSSTCFARLPGSTPATLLGALDSPRAARVPLWRAPAARTGPGPAAAIDDRARLASRCRCRRPRADRSAFTCPFPSPAAARSSATSSLPNTSPPAASRRTTGASAPSTRSSATVKRHAEAAALRRAAVDSRDAGGAARPLRLGRRSRRPATSSGSRRTAPTSASSRAGSWSCRARRSRRSTRPATR